MPEPDPWRFEAIGTQWEISGQVSQAECASISSLIDDFDRIWSRFRPDSVVSTLAAAGGTATTGPTTRILEFYAQLHDLTKGAVNPLVGGQLAHLGYGPQLGPAGVVPFGALSWTDDAVMLTTPALIDIGAAGKGFLVDLVSAQISGPHVVDASGDLINRSETSLRVALEHPGDPELAVGICELAPGSAICASATNRRTWGGGMHHVIDARDGVPTGDVVATWAVSAETSTADGMATALFFADIDRDEPVEWVRMHADGRAEWSADWPGEVFAA